jgi:Domain of Unknown Function (DUF1206)
MGVDGIAGTAAELVRPRSVPRPLRPWVPRVARAGLAAKAAVYLTLGLVAARAAAGWGGRPTDTRGAVEEMGRRGGMAVAALVGLGLLCYAAWRFVQGIADVDNEGSSWTGLIARVSHVVSGIGHLLLGLTALGLAVGIHARRHGARWTARLLAAPEGALILGVVGVVVIVVGAVQFVQAYRDNFLKHVNTQRMSGPALAWLRRLGRFGHAARGVTFWVIGYLMVQAARHTDPHEARGVAGALRFVRAQENGDVLLGVAAAGVIAYGAFELMMIWHRRLDAGPRSA